MSKVNGNLIFNADASAELRNVYIERVSSDPGSNLHNGRIIYNTTSNEFKYYDVSVPAWVPFAKSTTVANLQTEVNNIETSLGALVNSNGVYQPISGTNYINGNTSIYQDLLDLDAAIAATGVAHDTLKELTDVDVDGEGSSNAYASNDLLQYVSGKWTNTVIGSASGVQAWDSDLDAIAGLTPSNGDKIKRAGSVWTNVVDNFDSLNDVVITSATANDIVYFNGSNWVNSSITTVTNNTLSLGDLKDVNDAIQSYTSGTAYALVGDGANHYDVTSLVLDTLNDVVIATPATDDFLVYTGGMFRNRTQTQSVAHLGLNSGGVNDIWLHRAGGTMSGNIDMGSNFIINLNDPVNPQDAATKAYVDAVASSLNVHVAVEAATLTALTANYANGSAGVGATLTATTNVVLPAIDGYAPAVGARLLVKNQADAKQNGIYVVTSLGVGGTSPWILTRSTDADNHIPGQVTPGDFVFVSEGSTQALTGWTETAIGTGTGDAIIIGTDPIVFTQFSGAGSILAGVGLGMTGNLLYVNLGAGIFEGPTDEVGIDLFDPANGALILTTTGTDRSTVTGAQLHLLLDTTSAQGANSIEQTTAGLRVKANGITEKEIKSTSFGNGITGGSATTITFNNENVGTAGTRGTLSFSGGKAAVDLDATGNGAGSSTKAASGNHNHTVDSLSNVTITSKTDKDLVQWDAGSSKWVNVAPSVVAGDVTLDNLNDVTITSGTSGQVLVLDAGVWVNKNIMYIHTGSGTSFNVAHSLNQKYCNVSVVDTATDEVIIPDSIVFTDANNLVVTVNASINVKIVVMGVAGIA